MAKDKKEENPQGLKNVEETLTRTEQLLEENYKPLLIGLAVLVILVGGAWLGRMYLTKKNEEAIFEWLKKNLTEQRFLHSVGTAECAVELAQKFNLDEKKAYIAGLLHDCAKCFSKNEMVEIIEKHFPNI